MCLDTHQSCFGCHMLLVKEVANCSRVSRSVFKEALNGIISSQGLNWTIEMTVIHSARRASEFCTRPPPLMLKSNLWR